MGRKTLCGWRKSDIKQDFEELRGLVSQPKYVCRRCARAASTPDVLCKPLLLSTGKKAGPKNKVVP